MLRLQPEHSISPACDKLCHQKGYRSQDNNYQCDRQADTHHKKDRAQNGQYTGKQLGKSHQKTIGKDIRIRSDTAHIITMGMGINIFDRHD